MTTETSTPSKMRKIEMSEGTSEADESREFDAETQKALEDIDACQNDIDGLNEKASEEILQTEQKYNKLRKPHFEKRNTIIERIPNFWVTAFVNHPQISSILDEEEEECLQYLTAVNVEEFDDIKSGYKITLGFSENPFFTNSTLVKEFHLDPTGDPTSTSTEIEWKEGKKLIKDTESMANGGKRKLSAPRTFFQWFVDNGDPSVDDIAEVLKDDMWPNPLQYFLAPDVDENGVDSEEDEDFDESVEVVGEGEDEEGEDEEELDDIDEEEVDDEDAE